jgi:type I restriction enzyme S subunit
VINTSIQQLDKREGKRKLRSGWHVVRFDQMAESILDRVDKPSEADVAYYVGLEHLDPESLKIRRWGTPDDVEATKLRFKPGDIIFGRRRAYQRKVAVAEFEGICSAHALVLRAREETVLKEFLPFFIQNDTFFERALSISVGSLSPTINWKTLAKQEFLIPPKDEQRRIADILWAADDTIIKWEQVLQGSIALRSSLIDTCISYNQELPDLQSYNEYLIVKLHEVCLRITDGTHKASQT